MPGLTHDGDAAQDFARAPDVSHEWHLIDVARGAELVDDGGLVPDDHGDLGDLIG